MLTYVDSFVHWLTAPRQGRNSVYWVSNNKIKPEPLWKFVWQILEELDIDLPYNLAISCLGIYPRKLRPDIYTKIRWKHFIAALFIIATNWKYLSVKLKYLSVDECIRPCLLSCFNRIQLFLTLWTVVHHVPLSMGFSRQEYWSGLPFPSPEDLSNPGIEPVSLTSPALALAIRFFTISATLEARWMYNTHTHTHTHIYIYSRILFGNKKEWSTHTGYNIDKPQKIILSERNQTQQGTHMISFI